LATTPNTQFTPQYAGFGFLWTSAPLVLRMYVFVAPLAPLLPIEFSIVEDPNGGFCFGVE